MAKTTTKPAGDEQQLAYRPSVDIAAPGGPRRRAGIEFGPVARTIPIDELTEEQLQAIDADPMLTIRRSRSDDAAGAGEDEPATA